MGAAYGDQGGLPIWHLHAIAAGQPVPVRWDPIPYSPIHDDDIAAQVEAIARRGERARDDRQLVRRRAVSVQEWSAYFGELLGVEAKVEVRAGAGRVASDRSATRRSASRSPDRAASAGGKASAGRPSTSTPTGWRTGERRYPSAEQLLAEAVETAGLSDFGPGDFRDGLDVLLDSLERDGDLRPTRTSGWSVTSDVGS